MTYGKKKEKALKWRKPQRSKSNRLEMRADRRKKSILRTKQNWHKQSLFLQLLFEWPTLFDFYNLFDIFPFYWFLIYHAYLLPFYSPDLNLIENLWSQKKDMQSKERTALLEGLKRIANMVWGGSTAVYVQDLSISIPQKMEAVVDAEGGQTNN